MSVSGDDIMVFEVCVMSSSNCCVLLSCGLIMLMFAGLVLLVSGFLRLWCKVIY